MTGKRLIVVCALWPLTGASQQKPVEFAATSEQVLVDAIALDGSGRPIGDLKAEDFEIRDGGEVRPVASFEAVHLAGQTPLPALAAIDGFASNALAQPQGRIFVVVFDDNHLSTETARAARAAVAGFVSKAATGDRVWLISTALGTGYQAVLPQGLTGLLASLDGLQGRRPAPVSTYHISDYEAAMVMRRDPNVLAQIRKRLYDLEAETIAGAEIGDGGSQSIRPAVDSGATNGLDLLTGKIQVEASQIYTALQTRRAATLTAMARSMDRLAGLRGRKTFLLVSEGFLDDPTATGRPELLASAQRANAALYFVDARGLVGGPWTHEADIARFSDQRDQLQVAEDVNRVAAGADSVALDTGGFTLRNTNDLEGALSRVASESGDYYLLGYEPPANLKPGTYRKISVRVRRPGVELRARHGYYVREASAAAPVSLLAAQAEAPFDAGGVPLRMAAYLEAPSSGGRTSVALEGELDVADVGPELETLLLVTPASGDPMRKTGRVATARAMPDPVGGRWASFEEDLTLGPGAYETQLLVRDAQSGRVGSVRQRIVVPEADGFRTSTPVLTDTLEEVEGGQLPVRLARRHFAPGSKLFGMFQVFGAAAGPGGPKVTVGYGLRRADGKALVTRPSSPLLPGPEGDLTQTLVIPLESLPQGRYALVLQVRDDRTGRVLERSEPFVVGDPVAVARAEAATSGAPSAGHGTAGYLALVSAYRKGDPEASIALASWTLTELKPALDATLGGQGCDDGCRRAAAVLHLDAALAAEERGDATAAAAHVAAGRRFLEKSKAESFRSQWLLAVGYHLLGEARLREAEAVLEESAKAGSPDALLALGAIWDFRSTLDRVPPGTAFEATASGTQAMPQFQLLAFRQQALGKAEDLYRRALQARPDLEEAHLRLGRILIRRGRAEQAEAELAIAASSADPMVKVLALLLLGDVAVGKGREGEAIGRYRAALAENPRSQAARLALSYALVRSGERPSAVALVHDVVTASPSADEPMDGWLAYHLGPSRHLGEVMHAMRASLGS